MLRTIEIPADQITVRGDQIQLHGADLGAGRIIGLTLLVEEPAAEMKPFENGHPPSVDLWEKELDELLAITPPNPYPVDDSREAIYSPDPDEPPENQ